MTVRPARPLRAVVVLAIALVASLSACGGGDAKEPTAPVQPVSTDPLSSIVDSIRVAFNMPAMGAAIVTLDSGVTAVAVAGTRRATGGLAVSKDDLWHLGSNTKAITSLLAAVAVSENRIQWAGRLRVLRRRRPNGRWR
jgi:CubicO group peptidase (beta-lactamase class C family)